MRLKYSKSSRGGGALSQVVVFLLCLFAMVAMGWMTLLPSLFTSVISDRTGFPVTVQYFYVNPFTAEVRMSGLVMANPPGFDGTNFVEVNQFNAKADLLSLLFSNPELDTTKIDITRCTVVTNSQGANNLDILYRRLASSNAKPTSTGNQNTKVYKPEPLEFLIHDMDLRVGEVVVKDERPGATSSAVHKLDFQRSYKNVTPKTSLGEDLPVAVTDAGEDVAKLVSGNLKTLVTGVIKPVDQKTYAWRSRSEIVSEGTSALEENAKP